MNIWRILGGTTAAVMVLLAAASRAQSGSDDLQGAWSGKTSASAVRVVQGRITEMQGTFITVKTPDAYPGGPGVHAQFVVAGPALKVDVSHARILLPDGGQADERPLATGDRVLAMIQISGPQLPEARVPGNGSQTYSAHMIERLACSDRITTH